MSRIRLDRRLVLLDRLVVLTETDVGGAEIRQRVGAIRRDGERGLVGLDGAQEIAGLVQLERAREQPLEVLRWPWAAPARRREQEQGESEGGE